MPSSIFSYNLSRPYPFKWFTPAVFVGGIVALVLVSLINLATSGYHLVMTSSINPNVTQSTQSWYQSWPSFMIGRMRASCESSTIPVGTQLYTNNSALSYTLRGVYQEHGEGPQQSVLGSLVYHNNQLQNCSVGSIQIQIRSLGRSATQIAEQQTGALLTALTTCGIQTPQGLVMLNLTTDYELVIDNGNPWYPFQTFMGRDLTDKASLYLGETLLKMYWIQLTNAYNVENNQGGYNFYEGTVFFNRNQTTPNETEDIKSLDFFHPGCFFVSFSGTGIETEVGFCPGDSAVSSLANGPGNDSAPLPNIWIPADSISKALYSTVLADLGQHDPSQPNLLTDQGLLEYFTQNFTNISQTTHPWGDNVQPSSIFLPSAPYTTAQNSSAYHLGISASTLATNYMCQVPQLKPAASLIFAVLIADLVLLQGLWKLFTLIVDVSLGRKYPEMSYCKGRLKEKQRDVQLGDIQALQSEPKRGYNVLTQADEPYPRA
ncbi:hypothetical protein MMC12_005003 [Toensbergia leucococca]|nr:hypothetical protein [Toensbergia leucococca]